MTTSEWINLVVAISTGLLALFTAWLAFETRGMVKESAKSVRSQYYLQILDSTPIVVAELRAVETGDNADQLVIVNKGKSTALQVRFSCYTSERPISVAQYTLPPLLPGEKFVMPLQIQRAPSTPEWIKHLRIRYLDLYGKYYITEYENLNPSSSYYVWRRPWIGKEVGFPKPEHNSEGLSSKDLLWLVEPLERMYDPPYPPENYTG